jgi:AcrR family transcriptional regulator
MEKRRYRLNERGRQQEETRRRIVEATSELHAEVGPAATTISAVAQRAGVQRLTVYRHFPDDASLFVACARHSAERHPPPDPALWSAIQNPAERLQAALRLLYAFYAERAGALTHVLRDAERLPALRDALAPMDDQMRQMAEGLATGWRVRRGSERDFGAALGHALDFWTWRSFAGRGLSTEEAARLMGCFVESVSRGECRKQRRVT